MRCRSPGFPLLSLSALVGLAVCLPLVRGEGAVGPEPVLPPEEEITLRDYLLRVVAYNDNLQLRTLEVAISHRRYLGESGLFQPDFVGSYQYVSSERPNTVEQQRQQFSSYFSELNHLYQAGVESLVPSGARVRLGYSLSDLRNNLQTGALAGNGATNGEFLSFLGFNVTQPLLKNAGYHVTMAGVRVAAIASDVAFEEYRRHLMETATQAEAFYWQLYFAQEQCRLFEESVRVAENLLRDNREKRAVGKSSDLDVKEAEAGLALRRSKLAEARQKRVETSNGLIGLYSSTVIQTNRLLKAAESPRENPQPVDFFQAWSQALELNPDYLAQRRKAVAEDVRLSYARNQRLPQVDLKGSLGWYGLGEDLDSSWHDLQTGEWPAWTLGVEMRIPLGRPVKPSREYEQAQLRQRQSQLALQDVQVQIVNGLDSAIRKVKSTLNNVANYREVSGFYEDLFRTQKERLNLGQIDSQRLLETEEKLLESKNSVAESLVQHQRALLELELVKGTVLISRHLDLSREQLESRTRSLLMAGIQNQDRYDTFVRQLREDFERQDPARDPSTPAQKVARERLHRVLEALRERELRDGVARTNAPSKPTP